MVKDVKIYCIFHIDEGDEPILIQAFSYIDEMNEWLFENEDTHFNISIQEVNCSVAIPSKEEDLK